MAWSKRGGLHEMMMQLDEKQLTKAKVGTLIVTWFLKLLLNLRGLL
jgi:hypothetical protein